MKGIDHVGVAVADLAAARRLWDLLLGQEPECEDVPTQRVRTATYPCGIELIEPAGGDRITSYNVCYTKLLRFPHPRLGAVRRHQQFRHQPLPGRQCQLHTLRPVRIRNNFV